MDAEGTIREYGDAAGLIAAVREETARRIEALKKRTDDEARRMEEAFNEELRRFAEEQKEETERRISAEIDIIGNRTAIEKRKLRLNITEEYVRSLIGEAVRAVMENDRTRYTTFVCDTAAEVLSSRPAGDAIVRLAPGDASLEKEIRDAVALRGFTGRIEFAPDEKLAGGGIVLEDREMGVVYNYSMDRITYREYETIKREVLKIMEPYTRPRGR